MLAVMNNLDRKGKLLGRAEYNKEELKYFVNLILVLLIRYLKVLNLLMILSMNSLIN